MMPLRLAVFGNIDIVIYFQMRSRQPQTAFARSSRCLAAVRRSQLDYAVGMVFISRCERGESEDRRLVGLRLVGVVRGDCHSIAHEEGRRVRPID